MRGPANVPCFLGCGGLRGVSRSHVRGGGHRIWPLVHGFAKLSLQGVFDKPGMRVIGSEDLMPKIGHTHD